MDMNDRSLRDVVTGLGGRVNGYPRQTGFDITAASEVMGLVAVARDLADLRERLGAITVGQTFEGEPVTAEDLKAAGSMAVLLKDAIKPNLVQTLEGQPAFVHCGPFANIAHGNNSLVADRVGAQARRVRDHRVGLRLGPGDGEVLRHHLPRSATCGRAPSCSSRPCARSSITAAIARGRCSPRSRTGAANLARHIGIVNALRAPGGRRRQQVPRPTRRRSSSSSSGSPSSTAPTRPRSTRRSRTAARAPSRSPRRSSRPPTSRTSFRLRLPERRADRGEDPRDRDERCTARDEVSSLPGGEGQGGRSSRRQGSAHLPICMAKTHLSLSHDPTLRNAPTGFTVAGPRPAALHRGRLDRGALRRHA